MHSFSHCSAGAAAQASTAAAVHAELWSGITSHMQKHFHVRAEQMAKRTCMIARSWVVCSLLLGRQAAHQGEMQHFKLN
jgi:hypothetical protein